MHGYLDPSGHHHPWFPWCTRQFSSSAENPAGTPPDLIAIGLFPLKEVEVPDIRNHMMIIGKDASAMNLYQWQMNMARSMYPIFAILHWQRTGSVRATWYWMAMP